MQKTLQENSPEVLDKLAKSTKADLSLFIAQNHNTSTETLNYISQSKEILINEYSDQNKWLIDRLLRNPNTSSELRKLLKKKIRKYNCYHIQDMIFGLDAKYSCLFIVFLSVIVFLIIFFILVRGLGIFDISYFFKSFR